MKTSRIEKLITFLIEIKTKILDKYNVNLDVHFSGSLGDKKPGEPTLYIRKTSM